MQPKGNILCIVFRLVHIISIRRCIFVHLSFILSVLFYHFTNGQHNSGRHFHSDDVKINALNIFVVFVFALFTITITPAVHPITTVYMRKKRKMHRALSIRHRWNSRCGRRLHTANYAGCAVCHRTWFASVVAALLCAVQCAQRHARVLYSPAQAQAVMFRGASTGWNMNENRTDASTDGRQQHQPLSYMNSLYRAHRNILFSIFWWAREKKLLHFANCKRFKDLSPRYGSSSPFHFRFPLFFYYCYYACISVLLFHFHLDELFFFFARSISLSSACCALPSANMKSLWRMKMKNKNKNE